MSDFKLLGVDEMTDFTEDTAKAYHDARAVFVASILRKAQGAQPIGKTRLLAIEKGEERLTLDEMLAGWHICAEFDFGLTPGEQLNEHGECAWCGHSGRKFAKATIEELRAKLASRGLK